MSHRFGFYWVWDESDEGDRDAVVVYMCLYVFVVYILCPIALIAGRVDTILHTLQYNAI